MTITLLTATPRSGKTSYAVWHVIKPAIEAGRPVYTCGIPQLKLDTIQVKYDWLKKWSERQYNEDLEEDELLNLPNGCLVVIDEAWRLWPVSGTAKPSDDIEYLAMHGHHNIDFLIITQKPNLIHRAVIAQVSKHLHILPTWSGRKMLEWPEYVQNPSARSNRDIAVSTPYKVPTQSFDLYHSAQGHTKLKQKKPFQLYVTILLFLLLPVLFYYTYQSVFNKEVEENSESLLLSEEIVETEKVDLFVKEQEPIEVLQVANTFLDIQLVSRNIDWSKVSSCIASDSQCICYGQSAERLVVPSSSCELAVKHGWPGRKDSNFSMAESVGT
jgi:zona occludens toxin